MLHTYRFALQTSKIDLSGTQYLHGKMKLNVWSLVTQTNNTTTKEPETLKSKYNEADVKICKYNLKMIFKHDL